MEEDSEEEAAERRLRRFGTWSNVPEGKWLSLESSEFGFDKSLVRYLRADQSMLNAGWEERFNRIPWLRVASREEGFGGVTWVAKVKDRSTPIDSVLDQYPGLQRRTDTWKPRPTRFTSTTTTSSSSSTTTSADSRLNENEKSAPTRNEQPNDQVQSKRNLSPSNGSAQKKRKRMDSNVERAKALVEELKSLDLAPETLYSILQPVLSVPEACKAVAQIVQKESKLFKEMVLIPWQREREAKNNRKGLAAYAGKNGKLEFHTEEEYKAKMALFAPACLGLLEAMSRGKHKDATSTVVVCFDAMLRNKFHSGKAGNTTAYFELTVRDSLVRRSSNMTMVGLENDARRSLGLYPSSLRILENAISEARSQAPQKGKKMELGSWSTCGGATFASRLQAKIQKAADSFGKKTTAVHPIPVAPLPRQAPSGATNATASSRDSGSNRTSQPLQPFHDHAATHVDSREREQVRPLLGNPLVEQSQASVHHPIPHSFTRGNSLSHPEPPNHMQIPPQQSTDTGRTYHASSQQINQPVGQLQQHLEQQQQTEQHQIHQQHMQHQQQQMHQQHMQQQHIRQQHIQQQHIQQQHIQQQQQHMQQQHIQQQHIQHTQHQMRQPQQQIQQQPVPREHQVEQAREQHQIQQRIAQQVQREVEQQMQQQQMQPHQVQQQIARQVQQELQQQMQPHQELPPMRHAQQHPQQLPQQAMQHAPPIVPGGYPPLHSAPPPPPTSHPAPTSSSERVPSDPDGRLMPSDPIIHEQERNVAVHVRTRHPAPHDSRLEPMHPRTYLHPHQHQHLETNHNHPLHLAEGRRKGSTVMEGRHPMPSMDANASRVVYTGHHSQDPLMNPVRHPIPQSPHTPHNFGMMHSDLTIPSPPRDPRSQFSKRH